MTIAQLTKEIAKNNNNIRATIEVMGREEWKEDEFVQGLLTDRFNMLVEQKELLREALEITTRLEAVR